MAWSRSVSLLDISTVASANWPVSSSSADSSEYQEVHRCVGGPKRLFTACLGGTLHRPFRHRKQSLHEAGNFGLLVATPEGDYRCACVFNFHGALAPGTEPKVQIRAIVLYLVVLTLAAAVHLTRDYLHIWLQDPNDVCEARYLQGGDTDSQLLDGISSEKDTICVASGRVIQKPQGDDTEAVLRCRRCHHDMLMEAVDMKQLRFCLLCHARIARNS